VKEKLNKYTNITNIVVSSCKHKIICIS